MEDGLDFNEVEADGPLEGDDAYVAVGVVVVGRCSVVVVLVDDDADKEVDSL